MPNINAAVVGTTLIGIVCADRIRFALIAEHQLFARHTLIHGVCCHISHAALGKVVIIAVRPLVVRIADELEPVLRMLFCNLYKVIQLGLFRRQGLIFVKAEMNAVHIVVFLRLRRFRLVFRLTRLIYRFRCGRFFFMPAAEAIGQACNEPFVRNVGIVTQRHTDNVTFIGPFRIYVAITGADIKIRRNAVTEARFPKSRTFRTDGGFAVDIKAFGKTRFGDYTDLSNVIRIAPCTVRIADVIVNAIPPRIGGKVFVDGIDEIYFMSVTVRRIVDNPLFFGL